MIDYLDILSPSEALEFVMAYEPRVYAIEFSSSNIYGKCAVPIKIQRRQWREFRIHVSYKIWWRNPNFPGPSSMTIAYSLKEMYEYHNVSQTLV